MLGAKAAGVPDVDTAMQLCLEGGLSSAAAAFEKAVIRFGATPNEVRRNLQILPGAQRDRALEFIAQQAGAYLQLAAAQVGLSELARERTQLLLPEPPAVHLHHGPLPLRAPFPIAPQDIGYVIKETKVEWDMRQLDIRSMEELRLKYEADGVDVKKIFDSHFRQREALDLLRSQVPESQMLFCPTDEDIAAAARRYKALVSFGGDNSLQRATHGVVDDTPVIGVVSDVRTSYGALLKLNVSDYLALLPALGRGEYLLEPWTRIDVRLNGQYIGTATCDIFMGQRERPFISRHYLNTEESEWVEQKCSGMLCATGAGSSGWFKAASSFLYRGGDEFPPTCPFARWINTEISVRVNSLRDNGISMPPHPDGTLLRGGHLIVRSLNDRDGILAIDSQRIFKFLRGAEAELAIADQPLWMVRALG